MARSRWVRGLVLMLAAVSLAGCVVVPARHAYRPVYYYR
jgi:hypothetical protein